MGILGARGDHPVYLQPPAGKSLDEVAEIPGVRIFGSGVRCTWEVAEVVAELLGIPAPQPPIPLGPPSLTDAQVNHYLRKMPGLARYHELGLGSKLRDYQKVGTVYLALRSYGLNCDPPRAGKCIQALSAAVLQGARKILIVGPAQALMGWAEEAARWLDTEAVLLRGRSGHSARQFCKVCMGSGRAANATYCPACRLGNGQSNGTKILRLGDPDPDRELTAALGRAQVVIVNYELLQGQNQRNSLGIIGAREDLPGWGPTLARYHFDVAVGDEIHQLRGWGTDRNRAGQTKRERFIQVVDRIPTVWGLTGTPVFGEIKDLWGPLDAVSRGAITGPGRKWFKFTIRYPLHLDSLVWMADNTFKPISDVKVGDDVWGWEYTVRPNGHRRRRFVASRVSAITDYQDAEILAATLENGDVIRSTPDHPWLNGTAPSYSSKSPFLPLQKLGAGLKFAQPVAPWEPDNDYRFGYVAGALLGDGHARLVARQVRHGWTLKVKDAPFAARFRDCGERLGLMFTSPPRQQGEYHYAAIRAACAPQLSDLLAVKQGGSFGTRTEMFWRGFLAGIYDAEGSGMHIAQHRAVNPGIYAEIARGLEVLGFKFGSWAEGHYLRGRGQLQRFVAEVRPAVERKWARLSRADARRVVDPGSFSNGKKVAVVKRERLANGPVRCLTTSTGNFVADGYGTHNCNAHKGEHGWVYNGFSIYAETELPRRLIGTKIQRQRSEILAQMPPKQRIVHRIEQSATTAKALASAARHGGALDRAKITKLLGQTGAVKRDEVVANVMDQLSAGNKVIVYTLLTSSAERLHKELNKAAAKREWSPRMRQENLKTWMVHGNNVAADKRYHVARAFRDHPGAALLVATIDSMQVGLDLSGATNVHFAELHYSPAAAQQAEDRPYKPGITQGLTVEYYIVRSSIDERIEETLMPKLFAQEAAVAEPAAADMRAAFAGPEEDEDEIFARLTSAIRDGSAPDIEDIEED